MKLSENKFSVELNYFVITALNKIDVKIKNWFENTLRLGA